MRKPSWLLAALALGCTGDDDTDTDVDTDVADTDDTDVERARLDAASIPKYVTPLPIPAAMDPSGADGDAVLYRIAARRIEQQVLPDGYPMTTVFAYGDPSDPSTFHWPSWTVEARKDQPIRVTWVNDLVDENGRFVPHILPVDGTLHWANPPGPIDQHGAQAAYDGPVPTVVHVHGAHVDATSDGLPEAWYLPDAVDLPQGYARRGSRYATEAAAGPGEAVFAYGNDRSEATLLYHDHVLGITRLNVYAGLLGFWLIRDEAAEAALDLPGPAPQVGDPAGTAYYEVPLAIQDRSFWDDGDLFYPDSRTYFDGYDGPFWPDTEVPPIWNPEFFGDAMTVNGATWPYLEVEPRLYRFRIANGSNSRFLILDLEEGLDFVQIGTDAGLLYGAPVLLDTLLLGPAERVDVLVDFSGLEPGTELRMLNLGPDDPFKGLDDPDAPPPADPDTTGQVMQFRVVPLTERGDAGSIPAALPAVDPLTTDLPPRDVLLWEKVDPVADIPVEAQLGTIAGGPLDWEDPATEVIGLGDTEIWQIVNATEDAHPIHLHLVSFQVVDRRPFDDEAFKAAEMAYVAGEGPMPVLDALFTGDAREPEAYERGWKDTVVANPGEVTTVIATFDRSGEYVWHCHILEHEDNEMMRRYRVEGPEP